MRRFVALLLLLALLAGCSLNKQFVNAVDINWSVIGPRYVNYVEGDPNLPDDIRVTWLRTAEVFTELIEEAKKHEQRD
jgi:hypothetical protein